MPDTDLWQWALLHATWGTFFQVFTLIITPIAWIYVGNKSSWGPFLAFLNASVYVGVFFFNDLWIAFITASLTSCIHLRNLIKWRRE